MTTSSLARMAFVVAALAVGPIAVVGPASAQAPARGESSGMAPEPAPPALQNAPAEKIAPAGSAVQPNQLDPMKPQAQEPAVRPNATDGQAPASGGANEPSRVK